MIKRLLSILLATALIVSNIPVAFAVTGDAYTGGISTSGTVGACLQTDISPK